MTGEYVEGNIAAQIALSALDGAEDWGSGPMLYVRRPTTWWKRFLDGGFIPIGVAKKITPFRMNLRTGRVLDEVAREREKQDQKWGEQWNSLPEWVSIETEELGEVAMEANKAWWGTTEETLKHRTTLRQEWVQVAAVAVAAIENLDREGESWGV